MSKARLTTWPVLLLAVLTDIWLLAACDGGNATDGAAQRANPYNIAANFSPYEGGHDPNTGVTVRKAQSGRRLDPLVGYVRSIRTFGVTHGLERIPALAQARGFEAWAGALISRDRGSNEHEIAAPIEIGRTRQAAVRIVGSEVLLRGDLLEADLLAYMARFFLECTTWVRVNEVEFFWYRELLVHGSNPEAAVLLALIALAQYGLGLQDLRLWMLLLVGTAFGLTAAFTGWRSSDYRRASTEGRLARDYQQALRAGEEGACIVRLSQRLMSDACFSTRKKGEIS
jgi:hypothetical protein